MTVPPNVPPHVVEEIAMEQAASRASSAVPSIAHRSPSAIPAMELDEVIPQEEQLTSERYRTLLPLIDEHVFAQPLVSSQQTASIHQDTNQTRIAVPLLGHQRDQYQTTPSSLECRTEPPAQILQRLRDIVIHPDLNNFEALEQTDVQPDQQLEWDTQCSAKFRWIRVLIEQIWHADLHLALVIASGKRRLLLQRFLNALQAHLVSASAVPGALQISVHTDETPISIDAIPTISAIVNLDATSSWKNSQHDVVCIRLIVPYTIEHVELDEALNQQQVIEDTRALRQQAGRLDRDLPDIEESAGIVAGAILNQDPQRLARLMQLPSLDDTVLTNGHADLTTKRAYDDDSDDERVPAKRIKSEDPSAAEHIEPAEYDASSDMQRLLMAEQRRGAELEANLEDLQYRFEEMQRQLGEVQQERDAAIKTAQQAVTRLNDQADSLRTLKSSTSQLREQLAETEARFASHDIPERAEIEQHRQAAAKAVDGEEKAMAKLENLRKDLVYAQTLYQDASTKAQGLAGENQIMAQQLATAEAAASSERARLRQMTLGNVAKQLQRENKQLRTMIDLRELAITTRDEEFIRLKDSSSRGRVGTRGSSVPRSPRMSSPLKTMDARTTHSRHASPVATDGRFKSHPLRNS